MDCGAVWQDLCWSACVFVGEAVAISCLPGVGGGNCAELQQTRLGFCWSELAEDL